MELYILNIGIIIQARMASTRLPGKVLKDISGKNLLEHILNRLTRLQSPVKIVIATSISKIDDSINQFCKTRNISCFRGSEQNVLQRYYQCAVNYHFDHIVRLTADNPFIDIEELDNLIHLHITTKVDYSRSFLSLPKGVGAEIFTFSSLETSYINGNKDNHKEHANEYIEENEALFTIGELETPEEKNHPELSLTVDTQDDYEKACFIVKNSTNKYITTQEAIQLCLQYV